MYKVALIMTWANPNQHNNVNLCQCGMYTLMGFVESVGRLLHERVLAELSEFTIGGERL